MNYEEFIELGKKHVERGFDLEHRKNYNGAIQEYENAIKEYENTNEPAKTIIVAALYNQIGCCYFADRNFDCAIKAYKNATENDKESSFSYTNLGLVYYEKGDFSIKAMKVYCKALEFGPNDISCIKGFLQAIDNTIENSGDTIDDDIKKKLQNSPSSLVNLVGDILCEIAPGDWQKYIQLIHEVYNLLERLEKEIENNKTEYFYQYVSGDSVVNKIGKERSLWLKPACYQNDPDEGKHIFKYFSISIEKTEDNPKESTNNQKTSHGVPIAFIRSLSECEDDLVMWNSSYAGNGAGVSISVPVSKLAEAANRPEPLKLKDTGELDQTAHTSSPNQSAKDEKEVKMPMRNLYFARVLYLSCNERSKTKQEDNACLEGIKGALEKFPEYPKAANVSKDDVNVQRFKKFTQRIFLPIAHLIKSADYKHEKEWRLLYYTTIKEGKEKKYIQRDQFHIETEPILFDKERFEKTGDKEKIWLGPIFGKYPELEKMKIEHLFEYDGIADCVDIKTSEKRFRG